MRFCLHIVANCYFRFEYPPAPTPKKRSSIGGKTETFKVFYSLFISLLEHCSLHNILNLLTLLLDLIIL